MVFALMGISPIFAVVILGVTVARRITLRHQIGGERDLGLTASGLAV